MSTKEYKVTNYVKKRKALSGFLFETALPNEYLVQIGAKKPQPVLGGRRFRAFGMRKFIRIPAAVQTLEFQTDNANMDFQGLGIEGYAAWQINPGDPVRACETLDLFDAEDPVARTNHELGMICVEAVRHVIANMSIEDAHRKKEEIARQLKKQLQQVEEKWGIQFHQVGIRHVRVMSEHVFNDLQADFRNDLRLQSQTKEIETNRQITSEENSLREKTEMERLATDQKVKLADQEHKSSIQANELANQRKMQLAEIENKTALRETSINEERRLAELEHEQESRKIELQTKKMELEHEQDTRKLELETKKMELEIERREKFELPLLELKARGAELQKQIQLTELEVERARRDIDSDFSDSERAMKLIETLPQVAGALKIDNYTVMDGGANGVSPMTKMMQEVLTVLKTGGAEEIAGILKGKTEPA